MSKIKIKELEFVTERVTCHIMGREFLISYQWEEGVYEITSTGAGGESYFHYLEEKDFSGNKMAPVRKLKNTVWAKTIEEAKSIVRYAVEQMIITYQEQINEYIVS